MKKFFVLMLVASVAALLYLMKTELNVIGHNHYESRYSRLNSETEPIPRPGFFGLSRKELSVCSEKVVDAYTASVNDAYRTGCGYGDLSAECFGLVILLFVSGLAGIRAVRRSESDARQMSNQSVQPTETR